MGYNVYELYCPLESIGQFGPSADPAIVATRTIVVINCIDCNKFLVHPIRYSSKNLNVNSVNLFSVYVCLCDESRHSEKCYTDFIIPQSDFVLRKNIEKKIPL